MSRQTELEKILDIPNQQRQEPDFIKLYFSDIGKLWDLNKNAQMLLGEMMRIIEYNPQSTWHNVVILHSINKKQVFNNLKWVGDAGYVALHRGLKELIAKKIITKLETDYYLVSGDICTKANWSDIKLITKLTTTITYEHAQRTLITFVEKQTPETKEKFKEHIINK
jgi:hypothetical protein